jgi:glucosamine-6-phosphate deaminase
VLPCFGGTVKKHGFYGLADIG